MRRLLHTCASGVKRVDVWRPRSSAVKSILMKQLISSRQEALCEPTGRLKIGTLTMTRLKLNRVLRAMAMRLTFEMNSETELLIWATPVLKVRVSVTITQRKETTIEKTWEEQATSTISPLSMSPGDRWATQRCANVHTNRSQWYWKWRTCNQKSLP